MCTTCTSSSLCTHLACKRPPQCTALTQRVLLHCSVDAHSSALCTYTILQEQTSAQCIIGLLTKAECTVQAGGHMHIARVNNSVSTDVHRGLDHLCTCALTMFGCHAQREMFPQHDARHTGAIFDVHQAFQYLFIILFILWTSTLK